MIRRFYILLLVLTLFIPIVVLFLLLDFADAQTTQTWANELNWTDNSGKDPKRDDGELGFIIKRRIGQTGPLLEVQRTVPNITKYIDTIPNDTGLTEYCYATSAFNATGESANSNIACRTSTAIKTVPPAPGDLLIQELKQALADVDAAHARLDAAFKNVQKFKMPSSGGPTHGRVTGDAVQNSTSVDLTVR